MEFLITSSTTDQCLMSGSLFYWEIKCIQYDLLHLNDTQNEFWCLVGNNERKQFVYKNISHGTFNIEILLGLHCWSLEHMMK